MAMAAPFQFQPVRNSWSELLHLEERNELRHPSGKTKFKCFSVSECSIHGHCLWFRESNVVMPSGGCHIVHRLVNGIARGHVILFTLRSLWRGNGKFSHEFSLIFFSCLPQWKNLKRHQYVYLHFMNIIKKN